MALEALFPDVVHVIEETEQIRFFVLHDFLQTTTIERLDEHRFFGNIVLDFCLWRN